MMEVVTHIAAFVLGVVATILSKLFWWLFTTGQIKKGVKLALNSFTTSWDAFLNDKTPNIGSFSGRDVIPILSGISDIKKLIDSKTEILANPHLREASAIAEKGISIIEQQKRPLALSYGERMVSRRDIDELAKRAKKCFEDLERWRSKK